MSTLRWIAGFMAAMALQAAVPAEQQPLSVRDATLALRRAVTFFQRSVADQGGYLWRYSADLALREGEEVADATTSWVQPPGTPAVGMAFLNAWQLTGDSMLRNAAVSSGMALVRGQLQSGGWDYRIVTSAAARSEVRYRKSPSGAAGRNVTTLDDNTTQAALMFLMRLDQKLKFGNAEIHECAQYALKSLLAAQYPNGAWAQRFEAAPDPAKYPVLKASYPEEWPRVWPNREYRPYYTFNDEVLANMIDVMFAAAEIYQEPRYRAAALRAGDFIILAQMPEPQPVWAQQYDAEMHPAWARKFEPPSVTGGESQGVLRVLLRLYERTGDKKYLSPLPRALAYLKASELQGSRLARFYELKTNRPLYFTKEYVLTYESNDLPTHYNFMVGSSVDGIEAEYRQLQATLPRPNQASGVLGSARPALSPQLAERAARAVQSLDTRGAWVETGALRAHKDYGPGKPVIESSTFIRNVGALAEFISASCAAQRASQPPSTGSTTPCT